jgi:hypothetical protein
MSSGMLHSVAWQKFSDVSEVTAASDTRAIAVIIHRPDDEGSKNLWNVCKLLPDYTAQQLGRQPFPINSYVCWLQSATEYKSQIFYDCERRIGKYIEESRPDIFKVHALLSRYLERLRELGSKLRTACLFDKIPKHVRSITTQVSSISCLISD